MHKEALPPRPKQDAPRTGDLTRKHCGRAPLPAPEPPDLGDSDLELDYRSFEERCKAKPLPPGIALPPPAGASYSDLFNHMYTIEPEEEDEI